MNLLLLDCKLDVDPVTRMGSLDLARLAGDVGGMTCHIRRPLEGDLPARITSYDRVIISGSATSAFAPETKVGPLLDWMRLWLQSPRPLLGICFGHQMLARAAGGLKKGLLLLRESDHPEYTTIQVEARAPSPLLQGLPREWKAAAAHREEVAALPLGYELIATSKHCQIEGMQRKGWPHFGLQFHPERSADIAQVVMRNFLQ